MFYFGSCQVRINARNFVNGQNECFTSVFELKRTRFNDSAMLMRKFPQKGIGESKRSILDIRTVMMHHHLPSRSTDASELVARTARTCSPKSQPVTTGQTSLAIHGLWLAAGAVSVFHSTESNSHHSIPVSVFAG
jgi:hypothetical protein